MAVGNNTSDAVQGSLNAQSAVENNYGVSPYPKEDGLSVSFKEAGDLPLKMHYPLRRQGLLLLRLVQ